MCIVIRFESKGRRVFRKVTQRNTEGNGEKTPASVPCECLSVLSVKFLIAPYGPVAAPTRAGAVDSKEKQRDFEENSAFSLKNRGLKGTFVLYNVGGSFAILPDVDPPRDSILKDTRYDASRNLESAAVRPY